MSRVLSLFFRKTIRTFAWLTLVAASLAQAQEAGQAQVDPPKQVQASREPTRLALEKLWTAKRLTLKFGVYPELNGDYRIADDGTLSVPVIGRLEVNDLDASTLEQNLAAKLFAATGRQSYATVEVAEYRPVFVTGEVATSNAIPWHPGMTVLQAVTLAGGLYRPQMRGTSAADLLSRYAKAVDDRKRAMAGIARLKAEKEGREIEVPAELIKLVGRPEAESLVTKEGAILATRKRTLENQLSLLDRSRTSAKTELGRLREQDDQLTGMLELRRQQGVTVQKLGQQGLVSKDRTLEQDMRVLELEEKKTNIAVAIARIEATIVDSERQADTLMQTRIADNGLEEMRLAREMSQTAIDIEAATLEDFQLRSDSQQGKSLKVTFTISRKVDSKATTIEADDATPLMPDDVLVVGAGAR